MKGAAFFARPQPASRVAASVTEAPRSARLEAERRVRTPETAITNAARGAITRRGTAQPRVVKGSKLKPGRVPEAAPDACVRMPLAARNRFSEGPPGRPAQYPRPLLRARRPTAAQRPPAQAAASRRRV